MQEEATPWDAVTRREIRERLEAAFSPAAEVAPRTGRVFVPRRPISITDLLVEAVSRNESEANTHRELVWEQGQEDLLSRFLAHRPSWLVRCTTPGSMTSGFWGLGQFRLGGRGYIYFDRGIEEFGDDLDALPIYSAWEPARSRRAFAACFVATYERVWEEACLPPVMGERVEGPASLIREAMCNILARSPDAWDEVKIAVARELEEPAQGAAVLEAAARECGVSRSRMDELAAALADGKPKRLAPPDRRALVGLFWRCIEGNPF